MGYARPGHAGDYWGAPYSTFPTLEAAVNDYAAGYYADIGQNPPYGIDCVHFTCAVVINYFDPSTNGGLAANVGISVGGAPAHGIVGILATDHQANPTKNLGGPSGCSCRQSEGSSSGGSSPKNSSGDSAQDSHALGATTSFGADPINTATGNKFEQDTDFRGSEWLTFRRFYNSVAYVASTSMGPQWRHSFDRSLVKFQSTSSTIATFINLERPDGSQEQFKPNGATWVTDADIPDTITEQKDAQGNVTGYSVFIASLRHTEIYNASGQLLSVTDPSGRGITLTYSTAATPATIAPSPNVLLTVTDSYGRRLSFSYASNGNLSQVALPDGGTLKYAYDSNHRLASVTYPDSHTLQYVYNEPSLTNNANFPNALTGVIDEAGIRFESTGYGGSNGRAVTSSFAVGADATTVYYTGINAAAMLTSPLGAKINLSFQNTLGALKTNSSDQYCGSQCNQTLKAATYDANGYPSSVTDFNNNVTKTTYDSNGLLDQEIDAAGTSNQRTTTTMWNTSQRIPLTQTVANTSGATVASTAWVYNSAGQTLARCEIDPTSSAATSYTCSNTGSVPTGVRRWTYTYCTAVDTVQCPIVGLLLTTTSPRTDLTQTSSYSYYLSASAVNCGTPGAACYQPGDLKSVTDALGYTTTYASYDGDGRVTRKIDPNGVITDLIYTPRGWLASRTIRANTNGGASAGDATTTITYTAYGAVQTITDPDNITVTYGYDLAHRLTSITDAQGNSIQFTLDASGNRTAENTYAAGSTTASRSLKRTFNKYGQLTSVTDGLGHTVFNASVSGSYDNNGNLVQSIDALNIAHKMSYDTLNRVASSIENFNGTDAATKNTIASFSYDSLDRLIQITDPSSLNTTYGYDGLSNATTLQSPDSGTSSSTYDAAGNVLTHTDAKGVVSTSSYDALDRLAGTSYSDSAQTNDNVTYSYDDTNNVTGCASSYEASSLIRAR